MARATLVAIARAGWSAFGLTLVFAASVRDRDDRRAASPDRAFIDVDAPENADAVAIADRLLKIAALFQIFDASQATLANMLRGLHDSRIPLVIALLGYWAIGAPVGLALGFLTPLGAVGVWIGLALGLAVVAVLLLLRWLGKERRGFAV